MVFAPPLPAGKNQQVDSSLVALSEYTWDRFLYAIKMLNSKPHIELTTEYTVYADYSLPIKDWVEKCSLPALLLLFDKNQTDLKDAIKAAALNRHKYITTADVLSLSDFYPSLGIGGNKSLLAIFAHLSTIRVIKRTMVAYLVRNFEDIHVPHFHNAHVIDVLSKYKLPANALAELIYILLSFCQVKENCTDSFESLS